MFHGTGRRMEGSSVRGGDDEGSENEVEAKGELGDSRGNNCNSDKEVEKEMVDEGFRDGCSHMQEKRSLRWEE